MKWRIELDVAFDTKKEVMDLVNLVEDKKAKAHKPKGSEKIPNHRNCRYHHCTHDELNPTPCGGYVNIDFEKPKQNHT